MKGYSFPCLRLVLLLLIGVAGTLASNAQSFLSFEDATPPLGWTNTGINPLTTDSAHYKVGRKSLKWKWNANDTLKVDDPDALSSIASVSTNSIGFYTWVYNENPKNDSIKFLITSVDKTVDFSFKMYINFKGWRCVYVDLKHDLKYAYNANASKRLRYLNVISPANGNGNLFFDVFEMQNGAIWHKGNDFFVNVDPSPPYDYVSPRMLKPDTSFVNLLDSVQANIIQNKLETWIVDSTAIAGDTRGFLNSRVKGVQDWLREATTKSYSPIYNLKFQRQPDNSVIAYDSVTGIGRGLFPDQFASYSQTLSTYTTFVLLQLAINYKVFKVQADLERCINIFDWMYDQGIADSSTGGSLYGQNVRLTALPQAFFILRNDLPSSTYTNTLNTIRWLTMFGSTYSNKYATMPSKSADGIRSGGMGQLIYALSLKNQKERIVSLDSLQSFFNYAFSPTPGYMGIFKNDLSTYHHEGPYTSEYGDDALHQSSLIYGFFDNTIFGLNDASYNQLRNTWLRYDLFSTNLATPAGTAGRGPNFSQNMLEHTQALATLALTTKGLLDDSLKGTFHRLLNIDTLLLRSRILLKSSASIQYNSSIGAAKNLVRAMNLPIAVKDSLERNDVQFMPYSGLFINRNKGWLTTIKGFSKYIWDYEYLTGTNENYLGRYLSHGNMEISSTLYKKNRLVDSCFDWAHIAGTTAKYVSLATLKAQTILANPSGAPYWRYSDQTFLGGVRLNDSIGTSSMYLHDTTTLIDPTFRAKKSSFFFGDMIYCLGSGISNSDANNFTHTTLYQTLLPTSGNPSLYINGNVATFPSRYPSSTSNLSIRDSWGNAYIVYGGNDSLYINRELRDNLVNNSNNATLLNRYYDVAYLSHGKSPVNLKYQYAVLLQPTQNAINAMMNNSNPVVTVLQNDESAHAVYNNVKCTFGFSFFNPTATLNFNRSILRKVYSPSILMETINADSCSRTIAFTNPDLRRNSGDADTLFGLSKLDSVDIVGKYVVLSGDTSDVSLSYVGSNLSRLYINASEGKTYKVQLAAINASAKSLPFTDGSIAVVRLTSVTSAGNQVYVDEYDTLGNVIQTITLDSVYQPTANTSTEEGYVTPSGDGQYIGLTGYARTTAASGALYGSRFDTLNRAVAFIKYDGSIQRKNIMPSLDTSKLFYPKSVYTSNGTDYWLGYGHLSGNYGGILYGKITASTKPDTLKSITPWATGRSVRQLNLNPDDSTLYYTVGSSPIIKFSSSTLPKDSIVPPATQPANITMPSKAGAKSFFFVTNGNSKLLYVAYSQPVGAGIIKYLKNGSNGWDSVGYFDAATKNYMSITGRLTSNGVTLFAVRSAVNSNTNSALVKITDTGSMAFNLASAVVLDSGTNKIFRGVSVVPRLTLTIPGQTYGAAPFNITPPASNVSGTFTYTSSNPSVATINGSTVTIVGAGTTVITATQTSSLNYLAGLTSTTLTVAKAPLTITANPQTVGYGSAIATVTNAATYSVNGLVNGDAGSVIAGTATYTTNFTNTTGVGASGITITPNISGLIANNYTFNAASGAITVTKATPTITTLPTASNLTYGQTLAASTLSGGIGSVAGTFAFTIPSTAPNAGTSSHSVTFTPTDVVRYNAVTINVSVTVVRATPTIITTPITSNLIYGQTLAVSSLIGGVGSIAGTFAFTAPSTIPIVGTTAQSVTFTPTDAVNYSPFTFSVTVTTVKAVPFTNGGIAVVRLSSVSGGGNQVYVDEYDTLGNVKQSIVMDSIYQPSANSSVEEGFISLSGDGQYIGLTGYARSTTASGGVYGSRFDTLNRAIEFIKYDGTIKRKNIMPSLDINKAFYPKSVYTSNGTDFWIGYGQLSGNYGGIMYGKLTTRLTPDTLKSITPWATGRSVKQLNLNPDDSTLYFTQGASPFFKFSSSTLPTDSIVAPATQPATITMPSKSGAKSFFFVKKGTSKFLYVAYSSTSGGGIIKYLKNINNGWDSVGYYDTASRNYLSVTGRLTANGVTLFAVRSAVNSNTNSALVKINDTGSAPFHLATSVRIDSGANKVFRGVTIVPQTTASPTLSFTIPPQSYGVAPFTLTPPTSNSTGAFTYTSSNPAVATINGSTVTIVGVGTTIITATQASTVYYLSGTTTATLTVGKAVLNIAANAQSTNYGTAVAAVTGAASYTVNGLQNGDESSVISGAVTYTTDYTNTTSAGTSGITITPVVSSLTANNYTFNAVSAAITVTKATPTITTSPSASDIAFGQTLAASILSGGVASVAGTFAFTTSATAPNVGTASQSVTFTPTDAVNYHTVSFNINVTVVKATPTISTSPTATGITYGQTLASSTLSGGVASVAGTFAFTTPSIAPNAGTTSQSVIFTPTNTVNYNAVLLNVNVVVAKVNTTISTAPTAASITYGQTLAAAVLSGGAASVAGTFAFTNPSATPNAGTASHSVTFTPTDAVNYNTSTANVNVTVIKATPTIVIAPTAGNIMYGQTLAAATLSGGVASVAGTFAFTTPSIVPIVGVSSRSVLFTPTDVVNNNTVTISVNVTTTSASPFTKGGIAVIRLASVTSAGNQVFLDEYDTLGNVKQSILLDSIYQPSANTSTEEGYLTLSGDGQYVGITGYARTSNGSGGLYGSRFDTLNRAVAMVKFDGSIKRKNIVPSLDISKSFFPKSVYTSNGTDYWLGYGHLSGNYGGLMYGKLTTGLTPDTLKSITPWQVGRSLRQLNLNPDDSTLYFSQNSSPLLKFSSSTLPKDSIVPPATQPANITMPSKSGAKSFFFIKNGNSKLLYVAYTGTSGGGIIKYLKNSNNGWDSVGYFDTASRSYLSVTGRLTSNGVTLFAVRNYTVSNANSALVKINDTGSAPFNLATSVRLDSGANKVFRGVSIVPQTSTLPTMSFALPAQTYGDAPFTITPPSSNSTGAFTYTSSNPAVATINGTTVTIVGAGTTTITATQASTVDYLAGTISATFTVGKAVLNLAANAQSTNYGSSVSSVTGAASYILSGLQNGDLSSVISGAVTYATNYTNTTAAGAPGITITPVVSGLTANNYTFNAVSAAITVTKTTPTITTAPTAAGIIYEQTLAASNLSGGVASVAGTFAFTSPSTVPNVGTSSQSVTFTPTDAVNYNSVTISVNVTVSLIGDPVIYTVVPTVISGITTPDNSGYIGQTLTITGSNFTSNAGMEVSIGGVAATTFNVVSPTVITAVVPPTASNTYVAITNTHTSGVSTNNGAAAFINNGFISTNNGHWNNANNWLGNVVPANLATVTINSTITLNVDTTVASLTINTGATLDDAGATLTTTGSSVVNNGTHTGTGKILFSGSADQTITGTGTFQNLESAITAANLIVGSSFTINGNLTLISGGIRGLNSTLTFTGTGSIKNNGTMYGEFSGNTLSLAFNGTTTLDATSSTPYLDAKNYTIGVGGSLVCNGIGLHTNSSAPTKGTVVINGTLKTSNASGLWDGSTNSPAIRYAGGNFQSIVLGSTSTIEYTAVGAQTITLKNGLFNQDYYGLTCSGTGTKTILGDLLVQGNLSLPTATDYLDINGNTLTLQGSSSITGGLIGSSVSKITVSGNAATDVTLAFKPGNDTLNTLTVNRTGSGKCVLGSNLKITNFLYPTAGTLDLAAYDLTLKSTASGKAQVGAVAIGNSTPFVYGTGRFVVERYITNNRRGYRNLASGGILSDQGIYYNWQESGAASGVQSGYGMFITGSQSYQNGVDISNGLDYTRTGAASLWTYNDNDAFVPISKANGGTLSKRLLPFEGYFAFVRGDRTLDLSANPPFLNSAKTTLRVRGKLATGTILLKSDANPSYTVSGGTPTVAAFRLNSNIKPPNGNVNDYGYSLVGNPYACAINWNTVYANTNTTSSTISPYYWVWNQSLNNNAGGWITIDNSGNSNVNAGGVEGTGPSGGDMYNNHWIQPGQSFFIKNDNSGNNIALEIKETDKWVADNSKIKSVFGASQQSLLRIQLLKPTLKDTTLADGALLKFDPSYSNGIDVYDAAKYANTSDNIAILRGGNLAIESRQQPTLADTIPLRVWKVSAGTAYGIRLDGHSYDGALSPMLYDKHTGFTTQLANGYQTVHFVPTVDTNTYTNRFFIVFGQGMILPFEKITLRGRRTDGGIQLGWQLVNALAVQSVAVQKSADGVHFTTLYLLDRVSASDAYLDNVPIQGNNYYRIAATANGQTLFSNVVMVENALGQSYVRVVQRTAGSSQLAVNFTQMPAGKYLVTLASSDGKVVGKATITHVGGNATNLVNTNSGHLTAGVYFATVTSIIGHFEHTEKIMMQ